MHQNGYRSIWHDSRQYVSILHMVIWFHAALDAQNRVKFYWIDLIDAACCQLEDLSFAGKLYHQFEQQVDGFGSRIVGKASQCRPCFWVFSDTRPALIIVASNAALSGNVLFLQMPVYCKILFDVPFWLIYFWLILQHAFSTWRSLNGLRGWTVAFAWISNYDNALAPVRPAEGPECLKYNHKEHDHQCLSLFFKDWDQKTAKAVDVSWEGTIQVSHRTRYIWQLHWLIILSWTNLHLHTVNFIAYWVILVILYLYTLGNIR